ncbi:MAG TPA: hypothetical protein VND93_01625 [Myxococcales bacterium]|nr:hypothetical protein [Myxococcales bacterium]
MLVIASRAGASDRVTFLVHGLAWPLAVGFVYRPGPLRSLGIGLLVLVSSSIATYLLFFLVLWVSSVR